MSNFKLTDEAKSVLIKAISFADEDVYHHPKDRLIELIQSNNELTKSNLPLYYFYLDRLLNDYKSFLCRQISDCIDDEERKPIRSELHIIMDFLQSLQEIYDQVH